MILPPVVKLFDAHDVPVNASKTAIQTIDLMAETLDFTDYASRIIHPLVSMVLTKTGKKNCNYTYSTLLP